MLAKHVTVLVRRDMAEAIPVAVFEHEVEILKDIHGEGNVELIEDGVPDYPAVEIDSGEEMDRLMNTYGQGDSGQFYAERVYGRSHKGLEAFAHKPTKKAAAEKSKPAAGKAAAPGKKPAAGKGNVKPANAPDDEAPDDDSDEAE